MNCEEHWRKHLCQTWRNNPEKNHKKPQNGYFLGWYLNLGPT